MAEKKKKEAKKNPELPGMPVKGPLEKAAEVVLDKWEVLQGKKAELFDAKVNLLDLMKKANRTKVCLVDSNDVKRKIEYKESEGVVVSKAGPEE